jgi:hypothetical protein
MEPMNAGGVGVNLLNFDVEAAQADVRADMLLAQYVEVPQEGGWHGNQRTITYAFNMAAARCVCNGVLAQMRC